MEAYMIFWLVSFLFICFDFVFLREVTLKKESKLGNVHSADLKREEIRNIHPADIRKENSES